MLHEQADLRDAWLNKYTHHSLFSKGEEGNNKRNMSYFYLHTQCSWFSQSLSCLGSHPGPFCQQKTNQNPRPWHWAFSAFSRPHAWCVALFSIPIQLNPMTGSGSVQKERVGWFASQICWYCSGHSYIFIVYVFFFFWNVKSLSKCAISMQSMCVGSWAFIAPGEGGLLFTLAGTVVAVFHRTPPMASQSHFNARAKKKKRKQADLTLSPWWL